MGNTLNLIGQCVWRNDVVWDILNSDRLHRSEVSVHRSIFCDFFLFERCGFQANCLIARGFDQNLNENSSITSHLTSCLS